MKKKLMRDLALLCFSTAFLLPGIVRATGNMNPPVSPQESGSALFTLQDLWNRLQSGYVGDKRIGGFAEPQAAAIDNEGVTLNEVMAAAPAPKQDSEAAQPVDVVEGKTYWSVRTDSTWGLQAGTLSLPLAQVPKSGQTDQVLAGDDGNLQTGAWPTPRFSDNNNNGTITDNLTGLIWLKDADCFSLVLKTWNEAVVAANALKAGDCQLNDGSVAGDWRLPTAQELSTLVNFGFANPAIDHNSNPFSFPAGPGTAWIYWSSTTYTPSGDSAWIVDFTHGELDHRLKAGDPYNVWPVRE